MQPVHVALGDQIFYTHSQLKKHGLPFLFSLKLKIFTGLLRVKAGTLCSLLLCIYATLAAHCACI